MHSRSNSTDAEFKFRRNSPLPESQTHLLPIPPSPADTVYGLRTKAIPPAMFITRFLRRSYVTILAGAPFVYLHPSSSQAVPGESISRFRHLAMKYLNLNGALCKRFKTHARNFSVLEHNTSQRNTHTRNHTQIFTNTNDGPIK